jgi:hypothetical protein
MVVVTPTVAAMVEVEVAVETITMVVGVGGALGAGMSN